MKMWLIVPAAWLVPVTLPLLAQVAETVEGPVQTVSMFARAWDGGPVVFSVLLMLIVLSILTWAVAVKKILQLAKLSMHSSQFIQHFWDSRSLNDLNTKLDQFTYSPVREVFRGGYGELMKNTGLKDMIAAGQHSILQTCMNNLKRSIEKAKIVERQKLTELLPILAISASASPFIGLFGTVWGIMGAFEGIARTGNASLAAVAPGISEALIATAFGLGAAIPAVIGYNIANSRIRKLMLQIDQFSADFLNIVERYLVADKQKNS
jgi:biopolymer transport protein TolQ